MKTANFPRVVIEGKNGNEFPFNIGKDDWLISITDFGGVDAEPQFKFDNVLFLQFNDTQEIGKGEISFSQAEEIASFIKLAKQESKNIWVNCHAGICRSGAVVSILVDLGWEFKDSSNSPGRIPNYLVYQRIKKFFPELLQSWDVQEEHEILSGSDPKIWISANNW